MSLLVIVSADYGELSIAKYFLGGLESGPMPVMLVPAELRQREGVDAGIDVRTYRALADLRRAVEDVQPDTVLLFSGYLLTIGGRFSLLHGYRLFRMLRRRGVQIVTSDPFIGQLRGPRSLRFREILRPRGKRGPALFSSVVESALAVRAYLFYLQLRRHWHIYPAPVAPRLLPPAHRSLSFFNGATVTSEPLPSVDQAMPPLWLFVLSQVDYSFQFNRLGPDFAGHVAARLRDAARPGRRVLMIGPRVLHDELGGRIAGVAGIELRDGVAHSEYMRHLLQAERAFFWNYYSFSVLHRVLSGRPVHYFDEGHIVSILPAIGQAGIETFYASWRPPLLRVEDALDEQQIERIAAETRGHFARIKERMAAGLTPRQLLDAIRDAAA
jgi:hypothetical protein